MPPRGKRRKCLWHLTKASLAGYLFDPFRRFPDTALPVTPDAALRTALEQLATGASLTADATGAAFDVVMRGEASPVQTAALLMALRAKGETADEVAGAATALRRAMVRLDLGDGAVDTCGTGGGQVGTLNLSTAAAFVVAGAGVPVAKHGNRSFTSRSGSADVLEALGIDITLEPAAAARVFETAGIVFLFAPTYHPAMRHVGPVRRELGVPTIMNLLGPLVNPAAVRRQVIGVADGARAPLVADALARLGARHALVLHADVGMDEVSPSGGTGVWEVRDGAVQRWAIDPGIFGLACDDLGALAGGEPADNARRIEALLDGRSAPAVRCAVLLNAAAALYVSGNGWNMREAVARATESLEGGDARRALERLRRAAPRAKTAAASAGLSP
jgi:anthranilate phosphoribosyltransferase